MEAVHINSKFPEYKYFIYVAIAFLDIGVLFGGLNSWRIGGYFNVPEIHQTHWTSTLFGGVSLLILAQIYAILSHVEGEKPRFHRFSLVVLGLWIIGSLSNYAIVWTSDPDLFLLVSEIAFRVAAVIYLLLIGAIVFSKGYLEKLNRSKTGYLLIFAVVWFVSAMMFFNIKNSSLDRIFLRSYVYGFFSLSIFGIMGYIFPRWYESRLRSTFQVRWDLVLLNTAGIVLVIYDKYPNSVPFFFGFLGPLFWGLAGLNFFFWLFDQVYRTGLRTTLVGSLVAIMFLGFFVFDTFMKNAFPNWVQQSHVHFLFLGCILISITIFGSQYLTPIAVGIKRFEAITVGAVAFLVSMILLSFTIINWYLAGIFGFILFGTLITIQIAYFIRYR